jgi:hypothetical protein
MLGADEPDWLAALVICGGMKGLARWAEGVASWTG